MRDLKNKLTSSKNTSNIQRRRGKSFGYQVLGFGAGGAASPYEVSALIVAGGGASTLGYCQGGAGAGGYRTGTFELVPGEQYTATVGAGGAGGYNGADSSLAGTDIVTTTSAGGGHGDTGRGEAGGSGAGNFANTGGAAGAR